MNTEKQNQDTGSSKYFFECDFNLHKPSATFKQWIENKLGVAEKGKKHWENLFVHLRDNPNAQQFLADWQVNDKYVLKSSRCYENGDSDVYFVVRFATPRLGVAELGIYFLEDKGIASFFFLDRFIASEF